MVTKPQPTKDRIPVLLSSSFYVVSGSVGLEARALTPLRPALDTGAGYNLIHKRILPRGYEEYLNQDGHIPALCDANVKRLAAYSPVMLKDRLGNSMFTTRFMLAERLPVDVLIGTEFLKSNVDSIQPRSQMVELRGSGSIPILSTRHRRLVPKPFLRAGVDDDPRESAGSTPHRSNAAKMPSKARGFDSHQSFERG